LICTAEKLCDGSSRGWLVMQHNFGDGGRMVA